MADNKPETIWPGWETVRLIGRGSFGCVYEIQKNVLGDTEKAALKVISIPRSQSDIDELRSDGYDDESINSTFQSHLKSIVGEYTLMRRMNGSANVVNCDDIEHFPHKDGIGWDVFIKMELLTPLTKALPKEIPESIVVNIAKDLCSALDLCQKHNIVHRDIKPQNIFVSENGDYKLGDFGIAKTVEKTMGGTKIGTYKYMAPEVYNNQPYGSSADIYSLGLVLYWLLNERRLPFLPLPPEELKAGMDEEARMRRLSGESLPAPKNGSDELKAIVLKACAYKPTDRYTSAKEMLNALLSLGSAIPLPDEKNNDDHLKGEPIPQPKPAPEPTKDNGGDKESGKGSNKIKIVSLISAVFIALACVICLFVSKSKTDSDNYSYEDLQTMVAEPVSDDILIPSITEGNATTDSIELVWTKIAGAAGYRLYIYDENTDQYVDLVTTTSDAPSYNVTGLKDGVIYNFKIRAYKKSNDDGFIWGEASEAFEAATYLDAEKYPDLQTMAGKPVSKDIAIPTITEGNATTDSIELVWTEVADATGYRLYIYDENTAQYEKLVTTTTSKPTYNVTDLKDGVIYNFKIKAYKKSYDDSFVWGVASKAFEIATNPDPQKTDTDTTTEPTTKPTTTKPTTTKPTTNKPTTTQPTTTQSTTTQPTTTQPTTTQPTTTQTTTTQTTTTQTTTTQTTTTQPTTTQTTTTQTTTTQTTTTQIKYSDWVVGDWQDNQRETSELCQLVETRTLYPYFYYYCKKCGDGTRWYRYGYPCGVCGTTMESSYCKIVWLSTPWSTAVHYRPFGSDTGVYAIHIDTKAYWKWTDGSPKTQYKYKTRTLLNY